MQWLVPNYQEKMKIVRRVILVYSIEVDKFNDSDTQWCILKPVIQKIWDWCLQNRCRYNLLIFVTSLHSDRSSIRNLHAERWIWWRYWSLGQQPAAKKDETSSDQGKPGPAPRIFSVSVQGQQVFTGNVKNDITGQQSFHCQWLLEVVPKISFGQVDGGTGWREQVLEGRTLLSYV